MNVRVHGYMSMVPIMTNIVRIMIIRATRKVMTVTPLKLLFIAVIHLLFTYNSGNGSTMTMMIIATDILIVIIIARVVMILKPVAIMLMTTTT